MSETLEASAPDAPTTSQLTSSSETLQFAIGTSTLGTVLVAASAQGVCAVLIGDDADTVLADLRDRFPTARLERGPAPLTDALAALHHPDQATSLRLDLRGTVFQKLVWTALQAIPAGETRSYAEIGASIGQPTAARAIAAACAANPIAVLIPCHRVVRADGGLSGYRWGTARKRALLALESMVTRAA
jgi:AraC family transcriptional regulator of adaptative response/methylated-DNA-[protein]-cysteine methyltransferase